MNDPMAIKFKDVILLSIAEVRDILQCRIETARLLVKDGKLRGKKIAGKVYVDENDLLDFLKSKDLDASNKQQRKKPVPDKQKLIKSESQRKEIKRKDDPEDIQF